jgi:hypothetical protein
MIVNITKGKINWRSKYGWMNQPCRDRTLHLFSFIRIIFHLHWIHNISTYVHMRVFFSSSIFIHKIATTILWHICTLTFQNWFLLQNCYWYCRTVDMILNLIKKVPREFYHINLHAQVKTRFWNSLHQVRSKPNNTDIYEVNLQFLLILCKGSWFVCIKDIKYCLMQSGMPSSYWKI